MTKAETTQLLQQIVGGLIQIPEAGKKKDAHPFVRALDDGWKISVAESPGEGYCDHDVKVLHVPIDTSKCSERTRFHELAHVKWTPPEAKAGKIAEELDVPQAFLNAFEDARVNNKLARAEPSLKALLHEGTTITHLKPTLEMVEVVKGAAPEAMKELREVAAAMYVCSHGYAENEQTYKLARACGVPTEKVDDLILRVARPGAEFSETQDAAVAMKELLREPELPMGGKPESSDEGTPDKSKPGDVPDAEGKPASASPGEQQDEEPKDEQKSEEETPAEPKTWAEKREVRAQNKAVDAALNVPVKPSPLDFKPPKYDLMKVGDGDGEGISSDQMGRLLGKKHFGVGEKFVNYALGYDEGDEVESGVMQIMRPKLSVRITSKMQRPRVPKNDLAGGEIRGLHRIITDEKILRRKAPLRSRKKVGTLLIDTSSSMSVDVDDIDAILSKAPQVTVALYGSGGSHPSSRAMTADFNLAKKLGAPNWLSVGHLAIVAHKGKRVPESEMKHYTSSGNVVDLEALRWLAKQPGPRVWICDGVVTGVGDACNAKLTITCSKIAKRASVKRVPSLYAFLGLDDPNSDIDLDYLNEV